MPTPATRARKALLAVLAAMALLTGLIPVVLIQDHGLPAVTATVARRPDEDEEDETETEETEEETESSEDEETEETADEVDEDALPDNVKAILKKERKARRDAEKALRTANRASKPAPKVKPKAKPKPSAKDDADEDTGPSERELKATAKLQRANLIAALGKSKHGLIDPAAAAKLAIQDGIAEFDDDDEPVSVDDLVKDVVDEYAFLKGSKPKPKAPAIDASDPKSKKAPKLSADELEMATSLGMTPEDYALYKDPNPKLPAKKPAAK